MTVISSQQTEVQCRRRSPCQQTQSQWLCLHDRVHLDPPSRRGYVAVDPRWQRIATKHTEKQA